MKKHCFLVCLVILVTSTAAFAGHGELDEEMNMTLDTYYMHSTINVTPDDGTNAFGVVYPLAGYDVDIFTRDSFINIDATGLFRILYSLILGLEAPVMADDTIHKISYERFMRFHIGFNILDIGAGYVQLAAAMDLTGFKAKQSSTDTDVFGGGIGAGLSHYWLINKSLYTHLTWVANVSLDASHFNETDEWVTGNYHTVEGKLWYWLSPFLGLNVAMCYETHSYRKKYLSTGYWTTRGGNADLFTIRFGLSLNPVPVLLDDGY